jgi:hypothetical protein
LLARWARRTVRSPPPGRFIADAPVIDHHASCTGPAGAVTGLRSVRQPAEIPQLEYRREHHREEERCRRQEALPTPSTAHHETIGGAAASREHLPCLLLRPDSFECIPVLRRRSVVAGLPSPDTGLATVQQPAQRSVSVSSWHRIMCWHGSFPVRHRLQW